MRTAIIAALLLASCNRSDPPAVPQANDDIAGEPQRWDLQSSGEGAALVVTDAARRHRDAAVLPGRRRHPAGQRARLHADRQRGAAVVRPGRRGDGAGRRSLAATRSAAASAAKPRCRPISRPAVGPGVGKLRRAVERPAPGAAGRPGRGVHQRLRRGKASEAPEPRRRWRRAPTPAWSRTASRSRPTPSARSAPSRSGARGSQGRCVTYSHPEDQSGTRVWTRFSGEAANGTWSGSLGGKPFVMRTRPQANCSDGMSDNVYPIAVALTVGGEQRSGLRRTALG